MKRYFITRSKNLAFRLRRNVKFAIIILLCLYSISFILPPILAVESTPTSTPSADLKSKLKALQDEIASKATQLKTEISRKLQNKAYVGTIKSKSEISLSISIPSGIKTILVNEYTQYSGKKRITFKSLQVDDNIAALGDVDDKDVLTAKKIFKLDSTQEERKAVFGSVISIKDSILNIQTKDNQNFSILVSQDTSYQLGKDEINFGTISVGRSIVVIGINPHDNQIKARFIYVLPQTPTTPAQPSTPSATLKPTKTSK